MNNLFKKFFDKSVDCLQYNFSDHVGFRQYPPFISMSSQIYLKILLSMLFGSTYTKSGMIQNISMTPEQGWHANSWCASYISYFILLFIFLNEWIDGWIHKNLAARAKVNNWTVIPARRGKSVFFNRLILGISTTTVQASHSEVIEQHIKDPRVFWCVCFYLAAIIGIWGEVCCFIVFSWFRGFCCYIGYLFVFWEGT